MRSCRRPKGSMLCGNVSQFSSLSTFSSFSARHVGGWDTALPYTQCGMPAHGVSGPSGLRPGGCPATALVDALISGNLSCVKALRAKVASDLHGRQTFLIGEKPVLWQDVIVLFLWLGEPFSSLSTFSSFLAIATAVLAIARCGPSGLRPP